MPKKKILVILPKINNPSTGGQKYDAYLCEKLKREKTNLNFLLDKDLFMNSRFSFFYNFIYIYYIRHIVSFDVVILNSRLYPRLFFIIFLIKIIKNIEIIAIHHHYNYMIKRGLGRIAHKFLELTFLKRMSSFIIPSPYINDITNIKSKRKHLLEIGFSNNPKKTEENFQRNKLICVGTIEFRKGYHLLIEALNQCNNFELNIIGKFNEEDDYFKSLMESVNNYNLSDRIIFKGKVSGSELNNLYSDSSCFVFPSLLEGYGMVLGEALSYGLPIIAFNNTAIPYLVKDEFNGFLVENENVSDFANRVNLLLDDSKLRDRLSINARVTYSNLRKKENLDSDIELFVKNYLL